MGKVLVIVGPTAVGKTKVAIELAKHYNCEIISGDSVAVYKKLDIGSAKPTALEMDGVIHHLIDVHEPNEQYDVTEFQKEARRIMDKNNLSIICGGTGLYIQSALFNYEFEASKRDEAFEEKYKNYSNEELYKLLLTLDKDVDQSKIHPNNRKRVLRAIEIKTETSKSVSSFNKKKEPMYDFYIAYLSMEREALYERINKRVDIMFDDGLLGEVNALYNEGILPHAIGYQELVPFIEGEISLESAKEEIKKNTRHLAKRQETWFRNQMESHFYIVNPDSLGDTINEIINDTKEWFK